MARTSLYTLALLFASLVFLAVSTVAGPTSHMRPTRDTTSQADIDLYLSLHNSVRERHGAVDLTWNSTLADKAQEWVDGCKFQHSGGSLGPYGENLAAGTGDGYGITQAVQAWTNEESSYNADDPQASHYTQVVWKGTRQLGCAVQNCTGIFDPEYGVAHYYACEYFPQGNVIGRFPENVQS